MDVSLAVLRQGSHYATFSTIRRHNTALDPRLSTRIVRYVNQVQHDKQFTAVNVRGDTSYQDVHRSKTKAMSTQTTRIFNAHTTPYWWTHEDSGRNNSLLSPAKSGGKTNLQPTVGCVVEEIVVALRDVFEVVYQRRKN
jgi:hypothetical protein